MIEHASLTEAGGHAANEDTYEVRPHPADPSCWLVAVADGQGGRAGGARAAALACRTCLDHAARWAPRDLLTPGPWVALLVRTDNAVARDADAGLTTLVAFALTAEGLAGASSGDSAVLVLAHGHEPLFPSEPAVKHPPLGSGAAALRPFQVALTPPWTVLAVTDGVWKYAGWERVTALAGRCRGHELLTALRQAAALPRTGALQDDFTAVALSCDP
jgi:hypothetical protein